MSRKVLTLGLLPGVLTVLDIPDILVFQSGNHAEKTPFSPPGNKLKQAHKPYVNLPFRSETAFSAP